MVDDISGIMPVLETYDAWGYCPGCGVGGKKPADLLWWFWRGIMFRNTDVRYCAGGKEPTEPVMLRNIMGQEVGEKEFRHSCAGIMEPHLHLSCRVCGVQRLMKPMKKMR